MKRIVVLLGLPVFLPSAAMAAAAGAVLHDFTGSTDGGHAIGLLTRDAAGDLYGATNNGGQYGGGTAYKLSPPAAGSTRWSFILLHPFGGTAADGAYPQAGLTIDSNGNLFGTTAYGPPKSNGAGFGTVFQLTPPSAGQSNWKETILHDFKSLPTDCYLPRGSLSIGPGGVLYGTASNGGPTSGAYGCVFQLTPPPAGQIGWTETILHFFQGQPNDGSFPTAGLVSDSAGNLYGTTEVGGLYGDGTVFELTPPAAGQTGWSSVVLHSFADVRGDGSIPTGGLALDAAGAVYGTTQNGGSQSANAGILFKLTPPAAGQTAWTESVLHTFTGTGGDGTGTPLLDQTGAVYGVASGGGTSNDGLIYKLTPPAAGQTSWPETILYSFQGGLDGTAPRDGLIADPAGDLYGTATQGGLTCTENSQGCGTVFAGFH